MNVDIKKEMPTPAGLFGITTACDPAEAAPAGATETGSLFFRDMAGACGGKHPLWRSSRFGV